METPRCLNWQDDSCVILAAVPTDMQCAVCPHLILSNKEIANAQVYLECHEKSSRRDRYLRKFGIHDGSSNGRTRGRRRERNRKGLYATIHDARGRERRIRIHNVDW